MKNLLVLFSLGVLTGLSLHAQVSASERQVFLDLHNQARAEVGVSPMVWSDEVAAYAQEWADYLAESGCSLEHRSDDLYGENVYSGAGFDGTPARAAVESWVSEQHEYRGEKLSRRNFMRFGHYTQVVWQKTTTLGCGVARCSNGTVVVVCNYDPGGNYLGERPYER